MMLLEEDDPTEIEFKIGDKVMHLACMSWGTVIGFADHADGSRVVVKHEDPQFRDDGNGLKAWLPGKLRHADLEEIASIRLSHMHSLV